MQLLTGLGFPYAVAQPGAPGGALVSPFPDEAEDKAQAGPVVGSQAAANVLQAFQILFQGLAIGISAAGTGGNRQQVDASLPNGTGFPLDICKATALAEIPRTGFRALPQQGDAIGGGK